MNWSIFIITCIYFQSDMCINVSDNRILNEYLNKQSRFVRGIVSISNGTDTKNIDVEEIGYTNITLQGIYTNAAIFSFLNTTFLLLKNQLFSITQDRGQYSTSELSELPNKGDIIFSKAVQYKHVGILLNALDHESHIFGFHNTTAFSIQTISTPYIKDAHFFTNKDNLYLIVVDKEEPQTETTIYEWLGSHFDAIQTIPATGAFKIYSFPSKSSEILIILRYLQDRTTYSSVYEFSSEKTKKIQHLRTSEPINVNIYISMGKTFVIIYDKSNSNMIFTWEASKLVRMSRFETKCNINKSVVVHANASSIIVASLNDRLQIFLPTSNNVELEVEKFYPTNNSIALDIHTQWNFNTSTTFIVSLNEDNKININVLSFKIRFIEMENHVVSKDILANCLDNLEVNLYKRRRLIQTAREALNKVKGDSDGILKESGTFEDKLDDLQNTLEKIQPLVDDYQNTNGSDIIIIGKVIIKGDVDADNLTAGNIELKKINGQKWVPEQWLKYREPQTITGTVNVSSIISESFEPASGDPLFEDLLVKTGNQEITGKVTINNLTTDTLLGKTINDVPLQDLYLIRAPQPIRGLKTFRNLKTNTAKIDRLNKETPDNVISLLNNSSSAHSYNFDSHVIIEDLTVEWIDDVHWDTFRDSVFRIGKTTEISGDLTLPQIKVKRGTFETLSGLRVDELFTTSTDQIVEAAIEFNRIFAENIETNLTNNINLGESAARFGDTTPIEAPIRFDRLFVREDLELVGKLDESFFLQNGGHIIGTNESDLLQIYNGSIKIKGNLYLTNVTLQPNSKLVVSETEVTPDFREIYWTKSTKQAIPVYFEALNGISSPHLLTEKLNGVNFSQYMLNDDQDMFETSFHFINASVMGDITLSKAAKHTPDFNEIHTNSVKTNGSFIIKGKKKYTGTLRAIDLTTDELAGIEVSDVLAKDWSGKVTGKKTFTDITIKGDLKSAIKSLEYINEVKVSDFLQKVIYVDRPQNLDKLHFKQLNVENLNVTKLNDHSISEYAEYLKKMYSSKKIEDLRIDGNVTINSVKNLSKINDVEFEVVLNNSAKIDKSGRLGVSLEFLGRVNVENLITSYVNDLHLKSLTDRLLYRNLPQTITAPCSFTTIKTENITASRINQHSLQNLVDISKESPQTISVPNGIEFSSTTLKKSLKANTTSPCDLVVALKSLDDPPTQQWSKVKVKGNATLLDTENTLYRVFEMAVTTDSDHTIPAPVTFARDLSAQNVTTSKYINDVDIEGIVADAVVMDSDEEQIIAGFKIFTTLSVSTANVLKNTNSSVVNGYPVSTLNNSIVRKHEDEIVIRGKKIFFGGLQCERFYSKKVSNVDPNNLVSTKSSKAIPTAVFDTFEVADDLNVTSVNRVNLHNILQNRLLTEGPDQHVTGLYYFNNIDVENLQTPSINDIEINNVVFDTEEQNINGPKEFVKPVEIFGNAYSENINTINVLESYKKSLRAGNATDIDGNIINLRKTKVDGYINAEYINGFSVADIKAILHHGTNRAVAQSLSDIQTDIRNMINRYVNKPKLDKPIYQIQVIPSDYLYLEKSDALQISVPNILTATAIVTKGYVLIHVTGEESGGYCGLPDACKCPLQYSLQISPEHSVNNIPIRNKGSQRVFSFDDDEMIIHILTNTISTDSSCRTQKSRVLNEHSTLTWLTPSTSNTTGALYQYDKHIQGFISGAEFFTIKGKSYVIIARYYDPIRDTHNLDCTVYKFSENKTKAEEIQKIPTKGAWSLYLFYTAQGVTLIIGNIRYSGIHRDEETQIYRFREDIEQFELLRRITSYGCSLASGVVLDTDSLIILVHAHAPLQVLKYDHYYDNYIFYQSFELDTPVIGMSVFYTGGFGISDAYLCIVTGNDNYLIYSFEFIEGWKLESSGVLEGLKNLIPFELNNQTYLFAASTKLSNLLTVVKHGSV